MSVHLYKLAQNIPVFLSCSTRESCRAQFDAFFGKEEGVCTDKYVWELEQLLGALAEHGFWLVGQGCGFK